LEFIWDLVLGVWNFRAAAGLVFSTDGGAAEG